MKTIKRVILMFTVVVGCMMALCNCQTQIMFKNDYEKLNENVDSSLKLTELQNVTRETDCLIDNWVYVDRQIGTPKKLRLKKIQDEIVPALFQKIDKLSTSWTKENQTNYKSIKADIKNLLAEEKTIMELLNSEESYDEVMVFFQVQPMVEDGGDIVKLDKVVCNKLDNLIKSINKEIHPYLSGFEI